LHLHLQMFLVVIGEHSTIIGDKMPKEAYRINNRKIVIYCLVELFNIELS